VNLLQSTNVNQGSSSTQFNVVAQIPNYVHTYTKVVCLSYNSLSSSNFGSWIIVSGASDHICSSLSLSDSYKHITPVQVRLPNGPTSYAKISLELLSLERLQCSMMGELIEGF